LHKQDGSKLLEHNIFIAENGFGYCLFILKLPGLTYIQNKETAHLPTFTLMCTWHSLEMEKQQITEDTFK